MAPAAKRRRTDQVQEITFDPSAREEYLTGFHKRKQQRIQNAKEAAIKREKEEKALERKQLREQRKVDLSNHVAEFNAEFRKQNPDLSDAESGPDGDAEGGEWDGLDDNDTALIEEDEAEFVDEDRYTTVTVEAMTGDDEETRPERDWTGNDQQKGVDGQRGAQPKKRIWPKDNAKKGLVKKKKFRYESKSERAATRQKQKAKGHKAKLRRTGQ